MTVSSTTAKVSYSGNGSTTVFSVPFYFLANSQLLVVLRSTLGTETTQVLNTNYTVTGAGALTGGSITMVVAPASGTTLTISRNVPLTQETDLLPNDRLPAESIETALDKLTMIAQQDDELLDRSLKYPASDASISTTIPTSSERAGKYLAFNTSGAPIADSGFPAGVNVKFYGAKGDGVTDDTAAIQAGIDTGNSLYFPDGNYRVSGLTQSTNFQRLFALGKVFLVKNGNGPILTSSANFVELNGFLFNGTGYTGDNLVFNGSNARLINCSSIGAAGRALKITGSNSEVIGTAGSYTTTDATATGYDIELGVSGTATLYHRIIGVLSTQATGGILMTDVGGVTIQAGQWGKITINSGTSPAGVNGGNIIGNRILGDVVIGLPNCNLTGNTFANQTVTFAAGTSQCTFDKSNIANSVTVINNGNSNNVIERQTSTGTTMNLTYGGNTWTNTIKYKSDGDFETSGELITPNNTAFSSYNAAGSQVSLLYVDGSNNIQVGNNLTTGYTSFNSGSGGVYAAVAGTTIAQFHAGGLRPQTDDSLNCGASGQRWANLYGTNFRPGPGTGTVIWTSGTGTPEGAVTAEVGSLYTRLNGGAGTTLYVKESGSGNTGWVAK